MNCKKFQQLLVFYLDGVLGQKDKQRVEKHLSVCSSCEKVFEEMSIIKSVISNLPTRELPEGLLEQTYQRLTQTEQQTFLSGFLEQIKLSFKFPVIRILVPAVASVLVIIGLFYYYGQKTKVQQLMVSPEKKIEKPVILPGVPKPKELIKKTEQKTVKHTEVAEVKIDLPKNDISKIEVQLVASAKLQMEELGLRGPVLLRGPKTQREQELIEEFKLKLAELNLTFFELTPELEQILNRRYERYPYIKQLKSRGLVGEGNNAQLVILEETKLSNEQKKLIAEENLDRQRLLEILAKQYIEKKKIPNNLLDKVISEGKKILRKIIYETSDPGEFIQTPEGKWIKKSL
jgi:uncharacterized protein YdbL (DUF1318 family)